MPASIRQRQRNEEIKFDLLDEEQASFCLWLSEFSVNFDVALTIPTSSKVSSPIDSLCYGVGEVLEHYAWRAKWQSSQITEDWTSTQKMVADVSSRLKAEVSATANNEKTLLDICCEIIHWGGGQRARGKGADAFLCRLYEIGRLRSYLSETRKLMNLSVDFKLDKIERMNSMLTKIYAFMAEDGLPIYDSRVAAASACLVEIYRRKGLRKQWTQIPCGLEFQIVYPSEKRDIRKIARHSLAPRCLSGNTHGQAIMWADAKKRLGRVLKRTLTLNADLFATETSLVDRMHAFEASLFMLGYDLRCMKKHLVRI
jgi:hypothetical protein